MMPDPIYSLDQVEDYAQGDFSAPAATAQQNVQIVVKNRSSSGCLIVRKKVNDAAGGLGCSSSRNVFGPKKEKKRVRMNMSDSGSSDELLMPPRRRVAPETIRVCNVLSHFGPGAAEENDIGRKRIRNNETDVIGRGRENLGERKRNKLNVFELDEFDESNEERRKPLDDGRMERRGYFSPMAVGTSGLQREFETGSSRHPVVDRRSSLYLERKGVERENHSGTDWTRPPVPLYGEKYDSYGNIRVQGKNGLLKVLVNKKKVSESLNTCSSLEVDEKRKGLSSEDTIKRNDLIRPSFYTPKISEKAGSSLSKPKNLKKPKIRNGTIKDQDSEDSGTSLKLGLPSVENLRTRKAPLSIRSSKGLELHSEDSDTSLKLGQKNAEARKFAKQASNSGDIAPSNELIPARSKEGKVKRGTGTEKQKLREQIRAMLLNAGWTIDYRPRRNRDYLDAVYINPSGTAYWSIIKAYEALLKQSNDEAEEAKAKGDHSFRPLSDEVLSQLTRKTRKKMEKEMKKKQRDAYEIENAREMAAKRCSSSRHDEESMDSGSHEQKLSSFIKQSGGGKSVKSRMKGDSSFNPNTKGRSSTRHPHAAMEPSGVDSSHGKKSRKLGRCTLLVRNSNEGSNCDSEGYVPYSGKRTVLSWLIDCGAVQLSQKVRYMNRKRTKVLLEGWVTRDGIHCGCCSKILTVLKFEIHAGSKQRQPFQNICLDSGVSLLECQIDAWNRQESVIGFHSVDVHGDDPNDDACGLCGDGGDLICCDNCPSTFHQSCLGIEMLPPGDWHCRHCACNFCGLASEDIIQGDEATVCGLLTCSLCAKKYHKSCSQEVDNLSNDTDSTPCFCGKTCKEVFEQLQTYLGVKHELESGFSWCLIRRTDVDLDIYPQGLSQRVECNSKLAVALSVMDECFLPIVDRRSGINLLHNVLYNCGSNFSRLNYSSFYTAILERGDEIVSAASIRLHGTQLAEMPFIGTRHIYRRQGMCRRLFCAIESALCTMKVQKMIIPAISELTHTWTGVFGFTNVDRSLKQELKSVNLLVFPGIDLLQKQLSSPKNIDENETIATEFEDNRCMDVPFNETTLSSSSLDSSDENKNSTPLEDTVNNDLDPVEIKSPCAAEKAEDISESSSPAENCSPLDSSHEIKISAPTEEKFNTDFDPSEIRNPCVADKMDDISESSSPAENQSGPLDSSNENLNSAPLEETVNTDFYFADIISASTADRMDNIFRKSSSSLQGDVSPTNFNSRVLDDTLATNGSFDSYNEQKNADSIKRTAICADMESIVEDARPVEMATGGKHSSNTDTVNDSVEIEATPVVDHVTADVPFLETAPMEIDGENSAGRAYETQNRQRG